MIFLTYTKYLTLSVLGPLLNCEGLLEELADYAKVEAWTDIYSITNNMSLRIQLLFYLYLEDPDYLGSHNDPREFLSEIFGKNMIILDNKDPSECAELKALLYNTPQLVKMLLELYHNAVKNGASHLKIGFIDPYIPTVRAMQTVPFGQRAVFTTGFRYLRVEDDGRGISERTIIDRKLNNRRAQANNGNPGNGNGLNFYGQSFPFIVEPSRVGEGGRIFIKVSPTAKLVEA